MKLALNLLTLATLAALSNTAKADISIDVIGGSEVSFEGLIQTDGNWFNNDVANLGGSDLDGEDADFSMRRAEIVLKGKGPGDFSWVAGYDAYANKWLDANVKYKFSSNTSMTVGQYKQLNSLEELSSTKNNDFISKAMTTNMSAISRRFGAKLETGDKNWSLAGSVYDRELTRNKAQGFGYGARGTFAPILSDGNLLHFGLSFNSFEAEDKNGDPNFSLSVKPDADLSSVSLIGTGTLNYADKVSTTGLEGAYVNGPFKVQAEYMTTTITRDLTSNFKGDSWYLYGVWNITGETWKYKNGVIGTALPNEPSSGMWQLAARYDTADLNDGNVDFTNPLSPVVTGVMGGEQSNWTVGVNWYWRSNFKLAANYVMVDSSKYSSSAKDFVDDNPEIFEVRAQFYW